MQSCEYTMNKQLEFILLSGDQGVLVGASNLVNSSNWTGDLWYFLKEEDIVSDNDIIDENASHLKYSLPISVCDGAFLSNKRKVVIGNDTGWLSVYSIEERDEDRYSDSENFKLSDTAYTFTNELGRIEHDRPILSVSVSSESSSNQKIATGGMDCSIIIWDLESFSPEITYNVAHSHHVTCVRFTGDHSKPEADIDGTGSEILASTSLDGHCLLWDRRQPSPARSLCRVENTGLTAVEWLDTLNNQLIIGTEIGNLMLIDRRYSKDVIHCSESFSRPIYRIKSVSRDSEKFVAVSADSRTVKIFRCDGQSLEEVYTNTSHNDFVRGLIWMSDQDKLLSCSWDSKIVKHYPFQSSK